MPPNGNPPLSISVVISTYNQEEHISEAIESVLNQTQRPDELIIADDHSTDGTTDIIKEYKRKYPDLIKLEISSKNVGVAGNANSGFSAVTGNYVTLLAGDDRFHPEKLEIETDHLVDDDVDVIVSNHCRISEDGDHINQQSFEGNLQEHNAFITTFARDFWFRNRTQSIQLYDEIGGFDEELELYSDWDYTLRLFHNATVKYVPKPLEEYRIHRESLSSTIDKRSSLKHINKIFQKNSPLLNYYGENESQYVRERLFLYNLRQRAFDALDQGARLDAFVYYMKWVLMNPDRRSDFKLADARFALPERAFHILSRIYNSL